MISLAAGLFRQRIEADPDIPVRYGPFGGLAARTFTMMRIRTTKREWRLREQAGESKWQA